MQLTKATIANITAKISIWIFVFFGKVSHPNADQQHNNKTKYFAVYNTTRSMLYILTLFLW